MNKFEAVRWSRMPKSEVWVGYDPEHPPTPQDLMRREQMHGHWVKLADGREWLVPVVRAVSGVSPLPRKLTWDGSAWSAGEVKDHYKDLFAEACLFWDAMTGSDAGEITISDEADTAVRALAVNYRIGPAEISALGLFDTRCHGEVILAMVDWPMVAALAKKKAAEEQSLPPGVEG